MRIPLAGGSYKGRSTAAASQEMINLFQERGQDSKSEPTLVGVHGATEFATTKSAEVRGFSEQVGSYIYAVVGSSLYRIDSSGASVALTTIGNSTGQVSITDNGISLGGQLTIADGGMLKVWDIATSTLSIVTTDNTDVADFIDGYTVFPSKTSGKFYHSELNDSTDVPALNFSTAEGSPDNLVSLKADRRELWLFGEKTTEIWFNQGNIDNVFARFQSGFNQMGCAAPHTVARFNNGLAWLGINEMGEPVPVISLDYNPKYLTSNHPQVAFQIAQYKKFDDAFAYSYRIDGHEFYVLTFPTENITWCYDATEQEWHQRAHIISDTFPNRERFNCHVYAFGKHLVGDYANGKIYELSSDVYTMDGDIIPNVRTTMGMKDQDEDRIHLRMIQLTGEEGVGGDVTLTYSKDGGHTYSNGRVRSFGATGKYTTRCLWRKFSSARDWILRFTRSEDSKTVYTGLILKVMDEGLGK